MPLLIILVLVAVAIIWWLKSSRGVSLNERVYLRSRGYASDGEAKGPPVSKDKRLMSLLQSLDDVSVNSRQKAAEDITKLCENGQRDGRMYSPLVAALDDNSPLVRRAVAAALASLGDPRALDRLERIAATDESIYVRTAAKAGAERLRSSEAGSANPVGNRIE
jgi:hypothetical protein